MDEKQKNVKKSAKDVSLKQYGDFEPSPVTDPTPIPEPAPTPAPPEPEPAPVIKADPKVKKYRCTVKCWVSSKVQMFMPGDIAEFVEGEFVPSQFELIE